MIKVVFTALFGMLLSAEAAPVLTHEHVGPIATEVRQSYSTDCGKKIGKYTLGLTRTVSGGGVITDLRVDSKSLPLDQIKSVNLELNKFFYLKYGMVQCTPIGLSVTVAVRPIPDELNVTNIVFVVQRGGVVGLRSIPMGKVP